MHFGRELKARRCAEASQAPRDLDSAPTDTTQMIYALTAALGALVGNAHVLPSAASARVATPTMVASPRFAFYGTGTKPPALQGDTSIDEDESMLGAMYDNVPISDLTSQEIVWDLVQGNQRFVKARSQGPVGQIDDGTTLVQKLVADALNPRAVKALVVSCARSYSPVDTIFDAQAGDLQHLRAPSSLPRSQTTARIHGMGPPHTQGPHMGLHTSLHSPLLPTGAPHAHARPAATPRSPVHPPAGVCGNIVGNNDGAVGSIEFALARSSPKLLVVMANSRNGAY
jgi:hypothetical protein